MGVPVLSPSGRFVADTSTPQGFPHYFKPIDLFVYTVLYLLSRRILGHRDAS